MQEIQYNPFALPTAYAALTDSNSSFLGKIGKGAVGADYDIYLRNPYQLIIGNISKIIQNPDAYSTMTKVAVCAVAILAVPYTLMLYGSSIYLAGHCVAELGAMAGAEILIKTGQAVQATGSKVFLAGAVPIYATFYEGPKYILNSLPKISAFILEKVTVAANWAFQNIVIPAYEVLKVVATKISEIRDLLAKSIASAANWAFENLLVPLYDKIQPILHMIGKGIVYVSNKLSLALHALKTTVENFAQLVFTNVIVPVWNMILPGLKSLGHAISYLAKGFANVLSVVVNKVSDVTLRVIDALTPIWKQIILPVLENAGKVLVRVIQTLAEITSQAASAIFQNVIVPAYSSLSNAVAAGVRLLNTHLITLGTALTNFIEKISHVFNEICLTFAGLFK